MHCIIIAGSPETDINFIKRTVREGDYVICADRGYSHALAAGVRPSLLIGDFDSCRDALPSDCEMKRLNVEKDYTDTLHCIDTALQKGYDEITVLGALGGRLDHSLANLYALEYIANRGAKGVILSEKERAELLVPGEHLFSQTKGLTFSLFPFGCSETRLSIEGAKYPLSHYVMKSGIPIGVSNIFTSEICKITIYDGNAMIIINTTDEYL